MLQDLKKIAQVNVSVKIHTRYIFEIINFKKINGDSSLLYLIIVINFAVTCLWKIAFIYYKKGNAEPILFMLKYFAVSTDVTTIITSIFSHPTTFSLINNMIYFFIYGKQLLMKLGDREFCGLFLFSAVSSSLMIMLLRSDKEFIYSGMMQVIKSLMVVHTVMFPESLMIFFDLMVIPVLSLTFHKLFNDVISLSLDNMIGYLVGLIYLIYAINKNIITF